MTNRSTDLPLHHLKRAAAAAALAFCTNAHAATLRVTVENLSPDGGTFITPVWVGFHDGTFDVYDSGSPASPGLERIAEDGNFAPLSGEFSASGAGIAEVAVSQLRIKKHP